MDSPSTLERALVSKLQTNSSGHLCEYCNKKFSSKSALGRHTKLHLGPPSLNCSLCTFSTYQKSNLDNHIRTHTKEKPFKCLHPNCSSTFSRAFDLKDHQLIHSKDNESLLKFRCTVSDCQFKTKKKGNLKAHLMTHSADKPFSCSLCPFRSKWKVDVRTHHQNVHSKEKPFKCPESSCSFSCKQKGVLNRHKLGHSDERPFVCSFPGCDYKAKRQEHLNKHEMVHSGEKPFKCFFCNLSFKVKTVLVDHTRVHTGETPYPCQSCPYQSKHVSGLARHVKRRHNLVNKSSKNKSLKTKAARIPSQMVGFYKCQVTACGFSTAQNSNLAFHLNTVHNLPRVSLVSCQMPI